MEKLEANIRQIDSWKSDSWKSVEFYNQWFMSYAPKAFRSARKGVLTRVNDTFTHTNDLTSIEIQTIMDYPQILEVLRMVTAPPLAQDRLVGLSNMNKSILKSLENGKIPKDIDATKAAISKMILTIKKMIDKDIFPWLSGKKITNQQRSRSASIIADRLTGVLSDPIIRNEQEKRQLLALSNYLNSKGYQYVPKISGIDSMEIKTYSFHANVPVKLSGGSKINMPIDVVIKTSESNNLPILVECKSAGDFTNTNKRRKEEAIKVSQLKGTYGDQIIFCLYLCGYFDTGYLGYEAAEGIDWVWEHRTSDFDKLGI